ncbi:MAG TPA: acyl-CoA dehydrogenase family protein [Kofleriaceae bacterium]|nr:acyl-CoA dehydrogenase family protein [Kofleriaceae bacterium]
MELAFTPEHESFRREVRSWIQEALPADLRAKSEVDANFEMEEVMRWHRILFQRGWVAPHWPAEHGGPGLDPTRRFILTEELELAGTPPLSPFGLGMVGPLLIQFGTPAQKQRFLPKILSGEEVWCQGYSEPNAGSDLASLRTSAVKNGSGKYVVDGQKTWTTYAQYADWIFCLVRTDPKTAPGGAGGGKKQEGISFLLIDLETPGVEVKPMLTLGGTPAFCETFFSGAEVPAENLVGPEGGGWTLAKALLGHERTLIAAVGQSRRVVRRVKRIAAQAAGPGGRPLIDDPRVRGRIAALEIRLRGLQMANYRALAGAQLGKAPGPESSILKLRGSEVLQQAFELAMDIMGPDSLTWFNQPGVVEPFEEWVPSAFCYTRATTIYGGSNEIQKNVLAKYILGLPAR